MLAVIEAELGRLARYDDESVVHETWIRQRYAGGFAASYVPARAAAVRTAWHEAGHAVAALAVGARFSSASIRAGGASSGRVHAVRGSGELGFVVDAAGQVAERLRDWTLPETDDEVRAWLASWRGDGGDARRFRAASKARFAGNTAGVSRHVCVVRKGEDHLCSGSAPATTCRERATSMGSSTAIRVPRPPSPCMQVMRPRWASTI